MTKLIFGLVYLIIFPFFFILLIRPKVTGSFWIPRNPKKTNLQSMG